MNSGGSLSSAKLSAERTTSKARWLIFRRDSFFDMIQRWEVTNGQ
jgi:hypothetical protein